MRIHLIAIGGAIMHNLAMELADNGHQVTGSDDHIYDPAYSRLKSKGLLPNQMGWNPANITADIDEVIVGMHARADNPELLKAKDLGLKLFSFPEYMYQASSDKRRVVIAGSHGKTTTTSMVLYLLKEADVASDFLVGAQIEGFGNMVHISEADIAVFEGDEYSSSPLDPEPKFMHYKPHITVITGIAWDHINVFKTHADYISPFKALVEDTLERGKLFWYQNDEDLAKIIPPNHPNAIPYNGFEYTIDNGQAILHFKGKQIKVKFFGHHNFANLHAAYLVVSALGVTDDQFIQAVQNLPGPARRLEILRKMDNHTTYFDFAHAPSKVKATVQAVKELHPNQKIIGILELHTFSSLNKDFIPQYFSSLDPLDVAVVFYNPEAAQSKKMPILEIQDIKNAFGRNDLLIINETPSMEKFISTIETDYTVLLIMTSGDFGGINIRSKFST